ncbi:MAG: hypothetical protein LBR25_08525 [Erysipelotrichaceae bacterium]|nr:hypothetical protein [Erysipelotrichaceae bacterium]
MQQTLDRKQLVGSKVGKCTLLDAWVKDDIEKTVWVRYRCYCGAEYKRPLWQLEKLQRCPKHRAEDEKEYMQDHWCLHHPGCLAFANRQQ